MDALGNINWWGFSPALDFQLFYHDVPKNNSDELNILVVCAGDPRHILKTISMRSKWPTKKMINFYIYESRLELYARDCILLSLALEHPDKRGIQEKTELFMEVFANILVRDQTAQYIKTISNEFIKFVTDHEYLKAKKLECFDFSNLKHKECDYLEFIFKFWRSDAKEETFPAKKCWDLRLRSYLGTRYDSRKNAFDWDFSMKLADRKVDVINPRIYSDWRDSGVAFELRDANYDRPNLTLSSATVFDDPRKLDKAVRRGYFGDIVVGPFLCYGVETENKELLKKSNDHYKYTSLDITQSNVTSIMQSIIKTKGFDTASNDFTLAETVSEMKIVEIDEEMEEESESKSNNKNQDSETSKEPASDYLEFNDFRVIYLPQSALERDILTKEKYCDLFDIVYFSNCGISHMNADIKRSFKENCIVLFETAKYMIEMKNEQINAFSKRLIQIANENKFYCFVNESYDRSAKDDEKEDERGDQKERKIEVEHLDYFKFIFKNKSNSSQ